VALAIISLGARRYELMVAWTEIRQPVHILCRLPSASKQSLVYTFGERLKTLPQNSARE